MFSELSLISSFQSHLIFAVIFIYKRIHITFRYGVNQFHQVIYIIVVNFPAKFNLCFYFVAFCYGNIVHIVAKPANADMRGLHYTDGCPHPASQFILYASVCPVSYDNLSLNSHSADNMPVFSVPMGRLIFVHEVHIHCIIGNFFIELCVQMTQWFLIFLQTDDPHFGRRKCMHPRDHACTFVIIVCLVKSLSDGSLINQSWSEHYLKRQFAACIQPFHNFSRMLRYVPQAFIPV